MAELRKNARLFYFGSLLASTILAAGYPAQVAAQQALDPVNDLDMSVLKPIILSQDPQAETSTIGVAAERPSRDKFMSRMRLRAPEVENFPDTLVPVETVSAPMASPSSMMTPLSTFDAGPAFPSLAAPPFQSVDANGVDALSGSFNVSSPSLSMGADDGELGFSLNWNGKAWLPPMPSIWMSSPGEGTSYTVTLDGETAIFPEYGTRIYTPRPGDTYTISGGTAVFEFIQTKPNVGGTLICHYPLSESGLLRTSMPWKCRFMSREGKAVYFSASGFTRIDEDTNTVLRQGDASYYQAFSNAYMYPYMKAERDGSYSSAYVPGTAGYDGGYIVEWSSNSYFVFSQDEFFYSSVNFTIANMTPEPANRPQRQLHISTPGLYDGTPSTIDWRTASYLRPKNTIQTMTDPSGRQWKYTFNTTGNMTKVTTAAGRVSNIVYDSQRRVTSFSNASGTWLYSYSAALTAAASTTTITSPTGGVRYVRRTKVGGPVSSATDELGRTTTYSYDSYDRITSITHPEGNSETYTYDIRGNVTQRTQNPKPLVGGAPLTSTATFSIDCGTGYRPAVDCYRPSVFTDPKGNTTSYVYNVFADPISITSQPATPGAPAAQTRYTWENKHYFYKYGGVTGPSVVTPPKLVSISTCQTTATCTGTSDELITQYGYATGYVEGSGANNALPISVTTKTGTGTILSTTTRSYDLIGNVITVDGPLPGTADTVTSRYDLARQVTAVINPDPDGAGARKPLATRLSYNLDGQITLKEIGTVNSANVADWPSFSALQKQATAYDGAARPITTAVAGTGTTEAIQQMSYDASGRLTCSATRMNSATFPSIGAAGTLTGGSLPTSACVLGTTGTEGADRITQTTYNAASQITKVQTAVLTPAASDDITTGYTNSGKPAYVIDAENNRTAYSYDGHNRLVKTEYPSTTKGANAVNASDYEELAYDANGNITSRRLRDGSVIAFAHDKLNRVITKDLPGTEADSFFTYDLLGRPLSITKASDVQSFAYDALGRKVQEVSSIGTVGYSYDAAGRRISMTYPGSALTINYDYDVTGNVTAIRENGATTGVGRLASYSYDALGRPSNVAFGNGTTQAFTYDGASRLASLTNNLDGAATTNDMSLGFSYNRAGQIKTATRSNDAYAWTHDVSVDRPYLADGLNRVASAGATSFGYDARGNLNLSGSQAYGYSSENMMISGPDGFTASYDPLGRLKSTSSTIAPLTYFGYDGINLIAELDGSNLVQHRYVHGPGVDNPIVWYNGSLINNSTRRFLMADERGSIISVADSSGSTIHINSYDEYGIPAPGNTGRFGYTGQTWLSEIGMWYFKARIYSPTLGRFLQTDPIGYEDGLNWYNYVGGDPINNIDPLGMDSCTVGGVEIICVTGGGSGSSLGPWFPIPIRPALTIWDIARQLHPGDVRQSDKANCKQITQDLSRKLGKSWISEASDKTKSTGIEHGFVGGYTPSGKLVLSAIVHSSDSAKAGRVGALGNIRMGAVLAGARGPLAAKGAVPAFFVHGHFTNRGLSPADHSQADTFNMPVLAINADKSLGCVDEY